MKARTIKELIEKRTELYRDFKRDNPETIGETDKHFDCDNFTDYLVKRYVELSEQKLISEPHKGVSADDVIEKALIEIGEPIEKIRSTSLSHHTFSYDFITRCINLSQHPIPIVSETKLVKHTCKYCGIVTVHPDEDCYMNPKNQESEPNPVKPNPMDLSELTREQLEQAYYVEFAQNEMLVSELESMKSEPTVKEPSKGSVELKELRHKIIKKHVEKSDNEDNSMSIFFDYHEAMQEYAEEFAQLNKPKQVTEDEIERMANQEYPDDVFGRGNFINGAKWMLENNITLKEPKVLDSFKPCAECGKLKMIGVQCKNHNGVCSLPSSMLKEPKGDSVQTERESAYVVFEDSHEHEALIQLSVTIHDLEKAREYAKGWKNKTLYIYKFIE